MDSENKDEKNRRRVVDEIQPIPRKNLCLTDTIIANMFGYSATSFRVKF